jgi:hypothetical protein
VESPGTGSEDHIEERFLEVVGVQAGIVSEMKDS